MDAKPLPLDDARPKAILKAAFDTFARYGYRKTSMEDIAAAATMSRPALYLHFRNKEDIFRSLVQVYHDQSCTLVAKALSHPGTPAQVLHRAFLAQSGPIGEVLLTSPHADELLGTGHATCAGISAAGEARLATLYADWLTLQAETGAITLEEPPLDLARTMLAALHGVKAPPYAAYLASVTRLARLFGRGLSTRTR